MTGTSFQFEIDAENINNSPLTTYTFPSPMRIVLDIGSAPGPVGTNHLYLYDTETAQWRNAADTCSTPVEFEQAGLSSQQLVVDVCHLTHFMVGQGSDDASAGSRAALVPAVAALALAAVLAL